MNWRMEVLQTSALPLGYAASHKKKMERETGFEPATSTLARLHSTAELLPHGVRAMYSGPLGLSMDALQRDHAIPLQLLRHQIISTMAATP